jgi:hypothetical protein
MQFRTVVSTATLVLAALAASQLTAQSRAKDQDERSAKHSWYKLVDLGTLGGPQSYFASSPVEPYLNNKGIAVGGTDLAAIDPNSPNCASEACR